jgi:acyl-CoA reductase-like NAD-dependent aldehyde dehydrogenase
MRNNTFEESGVTVGKALLVSSSVEMDKALGILTTHKDAWAMMDIPGRIALLDQIKQDLPKVERRWITESVAAKGTTSDKKVEGEEWTSITLTYRNIRFLRKALQDIIQFGKPKIPGKVFTRPDGQVVAQVMPYDWKEQAAFPGMRAEVWMDPSVFLQDDGVPQASFYHKNDRKGQVCLVLGAGNVAGLVPADFLHKMFVEGQVVALKMNPVNEYMGPIFEEGFAALIKAGYLQILYGGIEESSYLCNHSAVDNVHLTGSDRTFDAIVFGSGTEGQRRKQTRQPLFTKPFSAELGNISPVIIVPGSWTEKEIKNQAARIGSWLTFNSGCNCLTPRMIIQMQNWELREKLNKKIADYLAGIKTRMAYYPGSYELHRQFINAHPQALQLGQPQEGHLPWTFIPDIDPTNEDDICFKREPFMSLFSETALDSKDVAEFIGKAVKFANEKLWGTLVASIIVHPASMKDPVVAAAVQRAIADLRYGSILINSWGAFAYYVKTTPWGGYPDTDIYDVQSGIGFVNNPLMFEGVQKSVVYAAFTPPVDPFLAHHSNSHVFYHQDTCYQSNPSVGNLCKLIWKGVTLK